MKIRAISGYATKGPACFLVETGGRRFLLDLGEGPEPGDLPPVDTIGQIDALLISHSHNDHIGGLDLLPELGNPPVYATKMVADIGKHPALKTAHELPLNGEIEIAGIPVTTGRASHAPGGVWIRIGGRDGVLYTGDWTRESALYPFDPAPPAALLICDCAYGLYDAPLPEAVTSLIEMASETSLLLPMPPAGRGLEAALAFLDAGFDVGLCPAHRAVAETLLASHDGGISTDGKAGLSRLLEKARRLDEASNPQGVMIAASGDAGSSLAAKLAPEFARSQSARIVFTGHLAKSSNGGKLVAAGMAQNIRWNVHPRWRDICQLVEQVKPQAVLPAFLAKPQLDDFIAANPDIRFAGPETVLPPAV